jgi:hypothetical protein
LTLQPCMERAGRVIGKLKFRESDQHLAVAAWGVAVGNKIAARTRAVTFIRSRLVVEVEDALWQRQLFTLREQILKRLEDAVGRCIVEELEFRIAIPKIGPSRAESLNPPADEADAIQDPVLRSIYKASRKKATA